MSASPRTPTSLAKDASGQTEGFSHQSGRVAADEIGSEVPPAGQPGGGGAERSGRRGSAWPLAAICVGYFMVILDTMVVNVALPALSASLHTTTTGLQWVVDAYSLVFAGLLLSAGALRDRRGAKAVFEGGIALFALASLACGLAPSTGSLIAGRTVQDRSGSGDRGGGCRADGVAQGPQPGGEPVELFGAQGVDQPPLDGVEQRWDVGAENLVAVLGEHRPPAASIG